MSALPVSDKVPPLVAMRGVSVVFGGTVRALDDVSLSIAQGDILGLVGESGSGKTTLCRVLVGLTPATSGTVELGGTSVASQLATQPLAFRRRVQMLLQDAVASLSPRMRLGRTLEEPIAIHGLPRQEALQRLQGILQRLGLPADVVAKYPHQISGGQARRIGVARALVMQPELIVADEPTAGLDVSVQGELLNLLLDLQREFSLTYLLVSHNLNVIRRVTRRTAVMYLGQIVEEAPTRALFQRPAHPYSAALLSTNPAIDPEHRARRIVLQGEIPSVVNPPPGCRFHTRCPVAQPRCSTDAPPLMSIAGPPQERLHPLGGPGEARVGGATIELGEARRVRCHFPYSLDATR